MLTKPPATAIDDLPRLHNLRKVLRKELAIIALAQKAKILAVGTIRSRQSSIRSHLAHLRLVKPTQREKRARKLRRRQHVRT